MRAKLLFFIVEYANSRRSCRLRRLVYSLKVVSNNFLQGVWGTKEKYRREQGNKNLL